MSHPGVSNTLLSLVMTGLGMVGLLALPGVIRRRSDDSGDAAPS
ncbi:hypothetical protein ABT010_39075 [Streptomyces sp. NPDC002668]